jgi:RNase P subunit RPR2
MEEKPPENNKEKLSQSLSVDEVFAWLKRFKNTKCQHCGEDDWLIEIDEKEARTVSLFAFDGVVIEERYMSKKNSGISVFSLTCANCGQVMLFNYGYILDKIDKTRTPKE